MRASWRPILAQRAACTMAPDAAASSIPAVAERQVMGELRPWAAPELGMHSSPGHHRESAA